MLWPPHHSGGTRLLNDFRFWCHHRKSVDFSITSSVHSSLPKHLGSISKRPARFSSSHNMAPIAFLGAFFGLTGKSKRNLINASKWSSYQEAFMNELSGYVFSSLREGDIALY